MPITNWSTTAADNDDADIASGIALAEGQSPGQINDSIRAIMAAIKTWYDTLQPTLGAVSGGATVCAITLPTGVKRWRIYLKSVVPGTNGALLAFQTSYDGGATYNASNNYAWAHNRTTDTPANTAAGSPLANFIQLQGGQYNVAASGQNMVIELSAETTTSGHMVWHGSYLDTGAVSRVSVTGSGQMFTVGVPTHVRLTWTAGTFASGSYAVYGVQE